MFHLKVKPSPPSRTGRETPGHAVDSSAAVMQPGSSARIALVQRAQEVHRLEVLPTALA